MFSDNKRKMIGNTMLFLCALVWGFAFAFQRSVAGNINPVAFNGVRFMLAAGTLAIVLIVDKIIDRKRKVKAIGFNKTTLLGGMFCGFLLLIACTVQQYGMHFTSAGKAGFITALYFVWVAIFGFFVLKKRDIMSMFAIPVAVLGFFLMCGDDVSGFGMGEGLSLLSTVFFAFQILCIDMFGKECDPIKLTFVQFVFCAVFSIPVMMFVGFPTMESIKSSLTSLLYVGICSAGIGYTLQTTGQKFTSPAIASLIMSLESVVGMIGGMIILGEAHGAVEICGGMIVMAAVFMSQLSFPKTILKFEKDKFAITKEIIATKKTARK